MLALADENWDERHVEYNPTSAFVGSSHMYLLNTYFVPGTIPGTEQDRQNSQSLHCNRHANYMLVKKTDITNKINKHMMSANEKCHGGERYFRRRPL